MIRTIEERFWEKVNKDTDSGCWEWIASLTKAGYGQIYHNGRPGYAHRISYTMHKGSIPDDLFVCHKCDNPKCVNPDHLFLGTHLENMRDCIEKGRNKSSFPDGYISPGRFKNGDSRNRSLSDDVVHKIRYMVNNRNGRSLKSIANEIGVDYNVMFGVKQGYTYKNVA